MIKKDIELSKKVKYRTLRLKLRDKGDIQKDLLDDVNMVNIHSKSDEKKINMLNKLI
jgi:hypothetical protein